MTPIICLWILAMTPWSVIADMWVSCIGKLWARLDSLLIPQELKVSMMTLVFYAVSPCMHTAK